jgi:hypothetical protein
VGKIRSLHIAGFADQKSARVPVLKENLQEWDDDDVLQAALLAEQLGLTAAKFVPIESVFKITLRGPSFEGVPIKDLGESVAFRLSDGSTKVVSKRDVATIGRPKQAKPHTLPKRMRSTT